MCFSNEPRGNEVEISCGCSGEKLTRNSKKNTAGLFESNAFERRQLLALSRRKKAGTNVEDLHRLLLISCCIRGVEREIDRSIREHFDLFRTEPQVT